MTHRQAFFKGSLIGLLSILLLNQFAAHLFSDFDLPALFGLGACTDAISRAGFPLVFFEQDGVAYRSNFDLLILDLIPDLGFALLSGSK